MNLRVLEGLSEGECTTQRWIMRMLICAITLSPTGGTQAQMEAFVNSLADDEFAHPYDFQVTPDFDESMDGICEDSLHRCTLRAALEEAANLGLYADVVVEVAGTLVMNPVKGSFYPPDKSVITAAENVSVKITAISFSVIFVLGNETTIYGFHLADALYGIVVEGNNNLIGTVTGNKNFITGMGQSGILVVGQSNKIVGNIIGLDRDFAPVGSQFGITVLGGNNVVGGIMTDQGNVISANNIGLAVYNLEDTAGGFNYVLGNIIGMHPNGTLAFGNKVGVEVLGPNVFIGGYGEHERNFISGNTEAGILTGLQADVNIFNNFIGTDITGTLSVPNRDGITLGPGTQGSIVDENLIRNNTVNGILINGLLDSALASQSHDIRMNTIVENQFGIAIRGNCYDIVVGSSLTESFPPNFIQFNTGGGVVFQNITVAPDRTTIRKNHFKMNGGEGISISPGCQNNVVPPELVEISRIGSAMFEVVGTHNRVGSVIDVYSGDLNGSNNWEGLHWLGSGVVAPDNIFQFNVDDCGCDLVVATATDPQGNTSEFSIGTLVTAVEDQRQSDAFINVFPNPFQVSATIELALQHPDEIELSVFDTHGKKITTLCNDRLVAGTHRWNWNPENTSAGIYYFSMISGKGSAVTGKLILLE